jgi:hypothetical protein
VGTGRIRMRLSLVLASAILATLALSTQATAVDVPLCLAVDALPAEVGDGASASTSACLEDPDGGPATAQNFNSGTIKTSAILGSESGEPIACSAFDVPTTAGPAANVGTCAGKTFGSGTIKVSK